MSVGACADETTGGLVDHGSCDVLIECAAGLSPELTSVFEMAYGPNGTCWDGGPAAWAGCRDDCAQALDVINMAGEGTGETCGVCTSDADCVEFGAGAVCSEGLCTTVGGQTDSGGDELGDELGETETETETGTEPEPVEGVSIMFVVDNSGSMRSAQRLLASSIDSLVSPLEDGRSPGVSA